MGLIGSNPIPSAQFYLTGTINIGYKIKHMSQTAKLFIVGVLFFLIGGGAFYAWSTMNQLKQQNKELSNQVSASPTSVPSQAPSSESTVTPSPQSEQTGKITGAIGFPSEGIPPLAIYAFEEGNFSTHYSLFTKQNETSFTMEDIAPGTYVVVAYTADSPGLSGGYTQAVPCGLSVDCTDHSLIPVEVMAGKTIKNVDVKDWYAPEGIFPAKPD